MNPPAAQFFDQWSIYDEILARNYMHHDDIYDALRQYFIERFSDRRIAILDLGCGSARHLAQALSGCAVESYVGYDLSEPALAQAQGNLAALNCAVQLQRGDLLAGLRGQSGKFDMVFASFALHHLSAGEKREFFHAAADKLRHRGTVLVIDTCREGGETRELYLERYCAWLGSRCATIARPAQELLFDHIRNCDYPETAEELKRMAGQAGLDCSTKIDQVGWHQSWSFARTQPRGAENSP